MTTFIGSSTYAKGVKCTPVGAGTMADIITGPGEYRQLDDLKATIIAADPTIPGIWIGRTAKGFLELWWRNGRQYEPLNRFEYAQEQHRGNIACKWSDPLPDMTHHARLLRPGEIVAPGDETFDPESGWGPSMVGEVVQKGKHFRRPLTSSPPPAEPQGTVSRKSMCLKSLAFLRDQIWPDDCIPLSLNSEPLRRAPWKPDGPGFSVTTTADIVICVSVHGDVQLRDGSADEKPHEQQWLHVGRVRTYGGVRRICEAMGVEGLEP